LLINLDNSLSTSTSPSLSRCENSTSTNSDKTNYLSNYNKNNTNNNETNDYVNSSLNNNNNNAPFSYESKIKHFVESYSSNENATSNNQQSESKFTLVNFHQPTSKFSNSSSTLSYLNEIEIPARLKRSSSFRSHPRKQQIIAQHQISKPEIVVNDTQVATKQAVVLTDSGFMSSFNSLSSSNSSSSSSSSSSSPPLLITGAKQINSTSPSSSSSSSPSTLNKLLTTPTTTASTTDHDRLKNTTVKSLAKTYENNNTVILPNYFKPKLINTEKSNSIIKIINNNNDNSRLIRTKFESFEMPDTNSTTTTTIREDDSLIKENEIDSMINLNVNEINLNNNNNNATDQQEYTKMNGYIISRIQNETTPQSCSLSTSPCSSPSLTMLTKQKLVKLNLGKSITYENDTDNKKQQTTTVSNSQVGNSFHKVLNKIVETGIQVTNRASSLTPNTSFSKPPISMSKIKQTINNNNNNNNNNSNTYSFEPINGYEDKTNNENNNESKLKKKLLYPYKSNSLTRQSKSSNENKSLFKLNEFESININKLSPSPTEQQQQQQQQQLDTTTTKKIDKTYNFFNNFNSSPTNRQKNSEKLVSNLKSGKNKSYSISSSLPSRNLGNKVVDDIKSLFDKFTNSSGKNSHSSKLKTNDTNDSENSTFYTNNTNDSSTNNSSSNNSHDNIKLTTFKTENTSNSRLKLSQSFSANINSNNKLKSEVPNHDFQMVKSLLKEAKLDMNECPDSPRKGALKKLGVSSRDSSATRSPLKVRWKDMIEISDLIEDGSNDSEQENYTSDDSLNCHSDDVKIRNQSSDTENYHSIDSVLNNNNKNKTKIKKKKLKKKSSKSTSDSFDIIVTSEKKSFLPSRKFEGKQQQFNLKPLHSTGKQFEKEMNERLEKLNQIKIKTNVESTTNEKFYDEIHSDLDVVLFELHSTIEHVRLSSMISNLNSSEEKNEENDNEIDSNLKNEEKISNVAQICRHFVNNSKNMISSALVNESEVKPFVRNAMNSLCSLVVQCLETNYEYLNKNKKLDETRQLLIQILNLLNTFRTTLNITYLASSKQLNEGNMNLLMKQATNLANEISLLIKHFKLLF